MLEAVSMLSCYEVAAACCISLTLVMVWLALV
jgi:hypothetical protein